MSGYFPFRAPSRPGSEHACSIASSRWPTPSSYIPREPREAHEAHHLHRQGRGREDIHLGRHRIQALRTRIQDPSDEHGLGPFPGRLAGHGPGDHHNEGEAQPGRPGDRHHPRDEDQVEGHPELRRRVHALPGYGGDIRRGDGHPAGHGGSPPCSTSTSSRTRGSTTSSSWTPRRPGRR